MFTIKEAYGAQNVVNQVNDITLALVLFIDDEGVLEGESSFGFLLSQQVCPQQACFCAYVIVCLRG